jgi:hypothetical protein
LQLQRLPNKEFRRSYNFSFTLKESCCSSTAIVPDSFPSLSNAYIEGDEFIFEIKLPLAIGTGPPTRFWRILDESVLKANYLNNMRDNFLLTAEVKNSKYGKKFIDFIADFALKFLDNKETESNQTSIRSFSLVYAWKGMNEEEFDCIANAKVNELWSQLMGENINRYTEKIILKNKVLTISLNKKMAIL